MAIIGFVGLGTMGAPIAGHLARAGHTMIVYNRTASRAVAWVEKHGGMICAAPANVASCSNIVMTCVGDDHDLFEVVAGDAGILSRAAAGTIIVDHTTASPTMSRRLSALAQEKGVIFLDAPVSGGQSGAENGQLAVMVGGDAAAFKTLQPIFAAYSKSAVLMGESGAGQLTKCCNQILIAGLVQALSEGLAFGMKAGLDMEKAIGIMSGGAAGSWQLQNRGKTMVDGQFDFGFSIDWMRKDLAICLDEARQNGARLPVTALVDQFYAAMQAKGGNRFDTSCLIELLRD